MGFSFWRKREFLLREAAVVLTTDGQMTLDICAALRTTFWERHRQLELHLEERNWMTRELETMLWEER